MKVALSLNQREVLDMINDGMSMPNIAFKRNVSRQAIYKTVRKLELKGHLKTDRVLNGKRDYKTKYVNGKNLQLHRVIYANFHGEIPKGHIIHHIDLNKNHNNIKNLLCLTPSEHSELHRVLRTRMKELTFDILKEIRLKN